MKHRGESGFTLIELVVTAAFMGIVVVAVAGLFTSLRQINIAANNYTIATQVAQQLMEQYRNTPYNNITVGTQDVTSTALAAYPSLLSPRSATVTISDFDPNGIKKLDVAISYKSRTGTRNIQMQTLISNKGVNK